MNTHSAQTNLLFTIGHSNLEIADVLAVLATHGVRTLCDVRSRPASSRFPQFNRESLESDLAPAGIRYEFSVRVWVAGPLLRASTGKTGTLITSRAAAPPISPKASIASSPSPGPTSLPSCAPRKIRCN